MTTTEQLERWVAGDPQHNHERGECCPDFSCCRGQMVELEVRQRFQQAVLEEDEPTQHRMLMGFLGRALEGFNVYVSGADPLEARGEPS